MKKFGYKEKLNYKNSKRKTQTNRECKRKKNLIGDNPSFSNSVKIEKNINVV